MTTQESADAVERNTTSIFKTPVANPLCIYDIF